MLEYVYVLEWNDGCCEGVWTTPESAAKYFLQEEAVRLCKEEDFSKEDIIKATKTLVQNVDDNFGPNGPKYPRIMKVKVNPRNHLEVWGIDAEH